MTIWTQYTGFTEPLFEPEVRDFSGPYGPDHRLFWIAIHMDGRRELVDKKPKRFMYYILDRIAMGLPTVMSPQYSLRIMDIG